MATHKVKKVAVNSEVTTEDFDIGGLKSSRYEKLQVSYGVIPADSYDINDYIVFSDVPARDIIRATVVAHATVPITLEVYPGADNNGYFTLDLETNQAACKLSYVIEYVRGTGRVGREGYGENASYDDAEALESGEGEVFKVKITNSAGDLTAGKQVVAPYDSTPDEE